MPGLRSLCTLCISASLATAFSLQDSLDVSNVDSTVSSLQTRDDQTPNGTHAVWLQEDMYAGTKFFDNFTFWDQEDPTHGSVTYVNQSYAASKGLISFTPEGKVIMKGDDSSWLPLGTYRESVRITSNKTYESGSLFILDIDRAPWGCGVWPAWWTVGDNWPWNGEIDIIEGVHDNEHNQVTWHTGPGCSLANNTTPFTGTNVLVDGKPHRDCNAMLPSNPGCGIIQWSRASYGPYFDAQGGGVFAMKWDEVSIAVWSFYRSAIPADITAGNPDPSGWGMPVAQLTQHSCNFTQFFRAQRIVFDITFCGDWAGNTYASTNCPGTCQERLMDPTNFQNASFIINSLLVYRKQLVNAIATKSGATTLRPWLVLPLVWSVLMALTL